MDNDLISRGAVLEELRKVTIITDDYYGMGIMAGNDHAIKKIEAAPSVDPEEVFKHLHWVKEALEMAKQTVAPVVRCKDCVYWQRAKVNHKGFLICPASGMEIMATDYCSYGERRENK